MASPAKCQQKTGVGIRCTFKITPQERQLIEEQMARFGLSAIPGSSRGWQQIARLMFFEGCAAMTEGRDESTRALVAWLRAEGFGIHGKPIEALISTSLQNTAKL